MVQAKALWLSEPRKGLAQVLPDLEQAPCGLLRRFSSRAEPEALQGSMRSFDNERTVSTDLGLESTQRVEKARILFGSLEEG